MNGLAGTPPRAQGRIYLLGHSENFFQDPGRGGGPPIDYPSRVPLGGTGRSPTYKGPGQLSSATANKYVLMY